MSAATMKPLPAAVPCPCCRSVRNPDGTRPAATQEAVVNLGNDWSGSIVILPTGERVLLTYRYFDNSNGGQISTAAVLLPPAPAERTTP